ncbi:MAG: hypothetical protein GVY36_06220 [Verrucomicrobia bacterium]|nr:hypothetical protein [Verrucomicrobiota bacterium]
MTGFWSAGSDFWSVNPERFPNGLTPILDAADEHGIEIGLWYAPDSDDDFANWERDVRTILELHRAYGVRFFKIDGLKVSSVQAYKRAHRLLKAVQEGADEAIIMDLDVTGMDKRPGYLGAIPYGPIFVENRYTDRGGYSPHHTLRNLWKLAFWIDPARLRMEFLNNTRRLDRYVGDPLAPSTYRPDYLFATVMMSNPLGWFEASNLPEDYRQQVQPLAEVWREHRDAIFTSTILPVGEEPSGQSWTGFLAVAGDQSHAYLLCLREHAKAGQYSFELPINLPGQNQITILHGEGDAKPVGGKLQVTMPDRPGHLLVKIALRGGGTGGS